MKKQTISLLLACAVALVFTGCATEHHSTAYEYKVIRMLAYPGETTKQLNDFAQQGWSVVTVSLSEEGLPSEKMMQTATIVLKRVLSGCAHDHPEAPSKIASKPATAPTATFNVSATGGAPVSYQWYINSTNPPAVTGNPNGSWELYLNGTNNPSK